MTDDNPPTRPLAEQITLNVKAEITRAGLQFMPVAEQIGLTRAQAIRRRSGETRWEYPELQRLASVLGINIRLLAPEGSTVMVERLLYEVPTP